MYVCYSCFKKFDVETEICPFCGGLTRPKPKEPVQLMPGTVLLKRYVIGPALNQGGFGIIYLAWDSKLDVKLAVKEFFNCQLMTRIPGNSKILVNKKNREEYLYRKERCLAEARIMAKLGKDKDFVNVFEFFEENDTAYIVMELLSGLSLNDYIKQNKKPIDADFALYIAKEIGKALETLHESGIIHRDVAPDNIFICNDKDLKIKLLDLGAAKLADNTDQKVDIICKPGFTPVEQYENFDDVGPWSDIYAFGASLYLALSGVKPTESTNRKTVDDLMELKELCPDIPDNLNNTIMKAMAIEKHMRFKDIPEFMNALEGNKKVVSLKKEHKKKVFKRAIGVIASLIIVAVIGLVVYNIYGDKKSVSELSDASIEIWYSVNDNSEENDAMNVIRSDFVAAFPNVEIIFKAIPADRYAEEINNARMAGELPVLFESTGLDDAVLTDAKDLGDILSSDQAKSCLFLEQYEKYYTNKKRIPLAIEVPIAVVITKGYTCIDYEKDTFKELNDFNTEEIAVDEDHKILVDKNYETDSEFVKSDFMNNTRNKCAVMLSTTSEINDVRENLTNYLKKYVYPDTDKIYCDFTYEWSIGSGSSEQLKAAERFLSWMLGNNYQNTLMISRNNEGQIPINEECFMTKIEQKNYKSIKDIYKKFVFEK